MLFLCMVQVFVVKVRQEKDCTNRICGIYIGFVVVFLVLCVKERDCEIHTGLAVVICYCFFFIRL